MTDPDPVAEVRAFTRFYTAQLKVLSEGLLDTPYSMVEGRLIFELRQRGSADAADLRRALGLDAGYLSRILARFEADGLVTRRPSPNDARRQTVTLTPAGHQAFELLDRRSNEQVEEMISALTEEDRRRLVAAMATVRELLGATPRRDAYILRPARPGDYGWVVSRHGALYAEELGWDSAIEAYCARVLADYVEKRDPQRENAWIAEMDGAPVGSIFCVKRDETTAQLRLLLVEPSARGFGIGARLVEECIRFARQSGYRSMMLFTTERQTDAARIYSRAGFTLAEQVVADTFEAGIHEQIWIRDL
jgi:DNA-binding MarR family transcriptional regulator/N-acetylglutamate synthase-like GNAT family acetyltransferase